MSSTQQLLLGEGAGGGAVANYIEDVFSTWLYTGNGSTQTITNNIDLSTKGGMVWIKCRSTAYGHRVNDTVRGASKFLATNSTAAQDTNASVLTAFTSSGFSVGASTAVNENAATYASWTFREQPKFFDVVTYTGNGSARTIAHNLGSAPGCIIIKCLNDTFDWIVWHRSFAANNYNAFLNTTDAAGAYSVSSSTAPTDTVFSLTTSPYTNQNGSTYVAYLFAHDAGGFGLTGTDNVISCGSFTTDGSGLASVTLGYEPQWMMLKASTAAEPWNITDTMRGWTQTGTNDIRYLQANTSGAEASASNNWEPNSTGFSVIGGLSSSTTYIYIAIRRGPMKVPTSGTSVFTPIAATPSAGATANIAVTPDMFLYKGRTINDPFWTEDRLRRFTLTNLSNSNVKQLQVNSTAVEISQFPLAYYIQNANMLWGSYLDGATSIIYNFKRAPSFFDVVCFTGTGATQTLAHNLGAVPEMMIIKARNDTSSWRVYVAPLGNQSIVTLNSNSAATTGRSDFWDSTTPTSTTFTVGSTISGSTITYVNYLFSTCAGVSKVGSYTGTATTKQIDCGFTGGARFVLIKRTDASGDWYVWDSARGIVSGNDPYLLLNSTAAEVTNTDYVDTYSAGFELSSTAPAALNASGGTYIFLAIA